MFQTSAPLTGVPFVPAFPRVERILILGMTPLAEQLVHEIEYRPGCSQIVVGVLDDVALSRRPLLTHTFAAFNRAIPPVP
jgi:hypothetical protein